MSKDLKQRYENIVNEYLDKFCKKQDVYYEYWVRDEVGGVVEISDCYFNFRDIKYDIDNNIPKGKIFDWYWNTLPTEKNACKKCGHIQDHALINYENYCKTNKLI